MAALWAGVVEGVPGRALAAFFPRAAYVQLKAVYSAGADWQERLLRDYALDLRAAHDLLAGTGATRLATVIVPEAYAHWVPPGVCENRVGYWEVPNARVVYRVDASTRSFGVASMISWRGAWYVVHLGAVVRPGVEGVLDAPAAGRGASEYSGTC